MATAGPGLASHAQALTQRIQRFTNPELKEICRSENLQVSGTKAVLQRRIGDHISLLVAEGNAIRFGNLRKRIYDIAGGPPPAPIHSTMPPHAPHGRTVANSQYGPPLPASGRSQFHSRMMFKDSPFITRQQLLAQPLHLSATPSGKGSSSTPITLTGEIALRFKTEGDLKILIYAAPDSPLGGQYTHTLVDIAFPQHIEVRVNGDEVRHNFKGLKNKPGSTKPADITDKVRKNEGYKNTLTVTYAYTDKASHPPSPTKQKWVFEAHLVRKHTAESLAKRIEQKGVFTKEKVLRDMQRKAEDPDIIATSSVMSLKDPVSASRITLPCRSNVCSHNGCFDATSFLQLQEQAPTWACPLCNKAISYEALAIDQYFQEILQKTSISTEQVTIEPDGRWHTGATETPNTRSNGKQPMQTNYDDEDSDDLVEITDLYIKPASLLIKDEAFDRPSNALLASTPPMSARVSAAPGTGSGTPRSGGNGNKRKIEVIDLTFSSDEEAPPPKRPAADATRRSMNGLNSPYTNGSSGRTSNGSTSYSTHAHSRPSNTGMPYRERSHHAYTPPTLPPPPPQTIPRASDYSSANYRSPPPAHRSYYSPQQY
ncbi:hypothetical protein EJ05DRAFT_502543 [Pseudovirgaria hyperparasitica]|uniref:E3 SUMO-protein ligase PIAS1 n=1 Tax=Pseudovirgaria hyperparasitica TaxID=470096 RepID=A0A6A6W1R0_9PEZI|nr:uncharacterized protein EJ05DRAFT_502543 [Pseudovirgaria hyperparasitica]KAF2756079.1 hypothetical protein EJ05DRAFT_502543 [Pseudovirgaria hyperparasitica]